MKKTNLFFSFLLFAVSITFLQSCSHAKIEKRVDDKLAHETNVKTRADLSTTATKTIEIMPGITEEQRSQLITLRDTTQQKMDKYLKKSLKLRSLLIKDVITPNYDAAEIAELKSRLKSLENKRLSLMFNSIDKANEILGHESTPNIPKTEIIHNMIEPHGIRIE